MIAFWGCSLFSVDVCLFADQADLPPSNLLPQPASMRLTTVNIITASNTSFSSFTLLP